MKMTRVNKVQFASLSDKRYCFSDGIFSLPFRHPCCQIYGELKKSYSKIHTFIKREKDKLIKLENQAVAKN